jgi:hypothetical protein
VNYFQAFGNNVFEIRKLLQGGFLMKTISKIVMLMLVIALLTGCRNKPNNTTPENTSQDKQTDVVTTASIVDNQEAFMKAISVNGTWIIAITKDLTIDKDLLVEGDFKNGKKDEAGNELYQRKIALYSQDENRTITARYILTAPKMTFNSRDGSLQHGTYKGDLYIGGLNFQLIDCTVEGNVYFTSQEAQNSFKMDETSKITGKQELQAK